MRDVADVQSGIQPRLGKVGWHPGGGSAETDRDDAVMGIVLLRRGENPDATLALLHKKIDELNGSRDHPGRLPNGVQLIPFIDRSDLVHTTTDTVRHNLLEGMALVIIVLAVFLLNLRASAITALTIPFALLFAFLCMRGMSMSANLISLGAVDFGIIVNGAVILVENVYRARAQAPDDEPVETTILRAAEEFVAVLRRNPNPQEKQEAEQGLREARDPANLARVRQEAQTKAAQLPYTADKYVLYASLLLGENDLADAQSQAEAALKLEPNDSHAKGILGQVLLRNGKLAEAERLLEEALKRDRKNDHLLGSLGEILLLRHDLPNAIQHLRWAIRANPEHARWHTLLAQAYRAQGNIKQADGEEAIAAKLLSDLQER